MPRGHKVVSSSHQRFDEFSDNIDQQFTHGGSGAKVVHHSSRYEETSGGSAHGRDTSKEGRATHTRKVVKTSHTHSGAGSERHAARIKSQERLEDVDGVVEHEYISRSPRQTSLTRRRVTHLANSGLNNSVIGL